VARFTKTLAATLVLGTSLGMATSAWAQASNTPETGGQLNKCWGQVASQTAQLDTPDGTSGGGMGQHSRSTQAANINGGFAADGNGFNIQFNVDGGRDGVGNVSAGENHNTHPGDGGNGQHAINNAGLAETLNPVTGQRTTAAGGTDEVVELSCVP
jgi:hypothetical protein